MKAATIAEKNSYLALAGYENFFSAMMATFITL
jgi:hypothetical protein